MRQRQWFRIVTFEDDTQEQLTWHTRAVNSVLWILAVAFLLGLAQWPFLGYLSVLQIFAPFICLAVCFAALAAKIFIIDRGSLHWDKEEGNIYITYPD